MPSSLPDDYLSGPSPDINIQQSPPPPTPPPLIITPMGPSFLLPCLPPEPTIDLLHLLGDMAREVGLDLENRRRFSLDSAAAEAPSSPTLFPSPRLLRASSEWPEGMMGEALSGEGNMSLAWREAWQPLVRDICLLLCAHEDHWISSRMSARDDEDDHPGCLEEGQGLIDFHQPQPSPAARLFPTTPVPATMEIHANALKRSGTSLASLEATSVSRESLLLLIERLTTSLASTRRCVRLEWQTDISPD